MTASLSQKRLADVRIDLDFFLEVFAFLSVLLIGADIWGVSAFGVNLRLDQLFLLIFCALLAAKDGFRFTKNGWVIAFALFSLVSTLFAFSFERGILYYFSILYNIVFLFYGFASYVQTYGLKRFVSLWRKTCYVQFGVMLLQFLLKVLFGYELPFLPSYGVHLGVPRFQLWFYEPSYLATYLSFWFAFSLYMFLLEKEKSYAADLLLALAMFVMSTSTSGFIAIGLTAAVVYLLWLAKGITAKKLAVIPIVLAAAIVFRLVFSNLYDVFIARLFNTSLDTASGGRISAWKETWDVFLARPIFGVGAGNYGLFLGMTADHVPTNVTLDLMATLGIFGTVAFYGLSVSLCVKCYRIARRDSSKGSAMLAACAFGLIIFTVILQFNQGYLRLYHWMFLGVLWGGILSYKKEKRI